MSTDEEEKEQFHRMLLGFRNRFPLGEYSLAELIQRKKHIVNQLVNEKAMCKKKRTLLKLAKLALAIEINNRNRHTELKQKKRWSD